MVEDNIKLYYFNSGGRAEPIRLALYIGGIDFEDIRLTQDQFKSLKTSGFFKFGQSPAIEINGKQFAQSRAIGQWAAQKSGLYSQDNIEILEIEELLSLNDDFVDQVVPIWHEQDAEKKQALVKKFKEETLPKLLGALAKIAEQKNGNFLLGNRLTYADLSWYNTLGMIMQSHTAAMGIGPEAVTQHASLARVYKSVETHPKVAQWISDHKAPQSIKLYYFNLTGRAESVRLALTIGGYKFEDIRLTGPEFGQKKQEGFLKFGQLPVVEIDGKQYAQSKALGIWAASKSTLYRQNPLKVLKLEESAAIIDDILSKMGPLFGEKDEQKKKEISKTLSETTIPPFLEYAEKQIEQTYFVGNNLSMADVWWYSFIGFAKHMLTINLDNYPKLKNLLDVVGRNPSVSNWNTAHQQQ